MELSVVSEATVMEQLGDEIKAAARWAGPPPKNLDPKDKTAYVFGGAGGIGLALGRALLKNGLQKLGILDIKEVTSEVRAQLLEINPNAYVMSEICDITDRISIRDMIRRCVRYLGKPHLIVNSAGIVDERDPARLINVNLVGAINITLEAYQIMNKEFFAGKGGYIVNIASIAGLDPTPFMAVYAASKFGLVAFSRSMGHDITYNRCGIRFIVICPGMTDTPLLSRFFAGEDLLFPALKDVIVNAKSLYPPQSPNVVGDCLIEALLDGENGSVWVSMEGENYKLKMPVLVNHS